jgi:hypothetical protein
MLQESSTEMQGCNAVAATSKAELLHADTTERCCSCLTLKTSPPEEPGGGDCR